MSFIVSCNGTKMNFSFPWCDRTLGGFDIERMRKFSFDFYRYSIVDSSCAMAMSISRSLSLGLNKSFTVTGKFSHDINRLHWRIQVGTRDTYFSFSCSFRGKFTKMTPRLWGWQTSWIRHCFNQTIYLHHYSTIVKQENKIKSKDFVS